jgi:hypothetical protein
VTPYQAATILDLTPLDRDAFFITRTWFRGTQFRFVARAVCNHSPACDPFGQGWNWAPSATPSRERASN